MGEAVLEYHRPHEAVSGRTADNVQGKSGGGVMPLLLVGVNHRTAPVEVRERLSIAEPKLPKSFDRSRGFPASMARRSISTCNRVEMHHLLATEDVIETVVDWLAERATTDARSTIEKHLYILRHARRGQAPVPRRLRPRLHDHRRAADRRAGPQSVSTIAHDLDALDSLLDQVFEQTMRVAKKVRTDTGIGEHAVSDSVRRSRAGQEDLRRAQRATGPARWRRRDGRAHRRASAAAGRPADLRRQQGVRARGRARGALRRNGRAVRRPRGHLVHLRHRHRLDLGAALRHRAGAGRARRSHAAGRSATSSSTSRFRATSTRRSPDIDGAYLYNIDDLAERRRRQPRAAPGRSARRCRSHHREGSRGVPQAPRRAGRRPDDRRAAAAASKTSAPPSSKSACARSAR